MLRPGPLGSIEHLVVLMFENRSFDNVLGGLYPYGPEFEGVPPGYSNPDGSGNEIKAFKAPTGIDAMTMPFPDPNEDFVDMEEQIDGGTMQGFVTNYAKALAKGGYPPATVRNIMQYYAPGPDGNMPITSALATAFAVSDRYFGSGPVQTWANRLFAHCGTPGFATIDGVTKSYLDNVDYPNYNDLDPFRGQLAFPTVFEQLDAARTDSSVTAWKVYYDDEAPISAFLSYVHSHWYTVEGGNVYKLDSGLPHYADFFYDVSHNSLPTFSFIEPRYQKYTLGAPIPPNSNHPGGSTTDEGLPAISVCFGEALLKKVYEALAANRTLFAKTLLVVTYDEHGGCFDHVGPPQAVSPFVAPETITNFRYEAYGPRVPAIFINPFIIPGMVLRPPEGSCFDHTSIIATLRDQFGLAGSLTPRVAAAPTFKGLIDESRPFNPGPELPDVTCTVPSGDDAAEPGAYVPPKKVGTVSDAIYRSFLARRT